MLGPGRFGGPGGGPGGFGGPGRESMSPRPPRRRRRGCFSGCLGWRLMMLTPVVLIIVSLILIFT